MTFTQWLAMLSVYAFILWKPKHLRKLALIWMAFVIVGYQFWKKDKHGKL